MKKNSTLTKLHFESNRKYDNKRTNQPVMRAIDPSDRISLLNVIILSEVLITAIENLKNTAVYNQQLKNRGELFKKECEKTIGYYIPLFWGADDKAFYHLMDEMKILSKRLSSSRPETWNIVNEMIDKYNENPQLFLDRNEITILQKD